MTERQYGIFVVDVYQGGYPVWVTVAIPGQTDGMKFSHKHLQDLRHAIDRAIFQAREELPVAYKHEVD